MIDALMTVTPSGLIPETAVDEIQGLKIGKTVRAKITSTSERNTKFFRKWWLLAKFAYGHWEPGEVELDGLPVTPQKTFDRFRKDLTILSGYYHADIRLDGSARVEARSIAWANMTEDEFSDLYSKTINVVLERILTNYTRDDLDDVVARLLAGYA